MSGPPPGLVRARPLAPLTTLGLGGPAAEFVEATERATLRDALAYAEGRSLAVGILGGGSNLVVGDAGFSGLVVRLATRGIETRADGDRVSWTVQAGEPWDQVVERSVREGLAGIECLSGIPGSAGATPIQNVGAYGQEVSDVIEAVEVLERATMQTHWLAAHECGFAYRDSRFKREPDRFVVLALRIALQRGGSPRVRYAELARALSPSPSLGEVQQAVRALRASKGMLIDARYEPSAGSFFTNPVVSEDCAQQVAARARALGVPELPRFAAGAGRVKLAAGWLVEHAGFGKGMRRGAVGISSRHALSLVHHGGGSTRELLALATEIQQQVECIYGVRLELEPVRWGA